jgi:protein TonB
MQDEFDTPTRGTWLLRAGLGLLALLLMAGVAWLLVKYIGGGSATKKPGVQQVAILKQPPPPPPKPPEKPPEPPKVKEEVKIDEPKPEPKPADEPKPVDDKPVSDKPLGVDADGGSGSDGFGLAGNRGGRDLLGTGGGSGRYFTGLLQRNFFEALARNRKAPLQEFSVVVSIWLGDDGRVQRSEIVNSSGDAQVDALIQSTLAEMPALRELPPSHQRRVQLRLNRRA